MATVFVCPRCDYTNKGFTVFLKHMHRKRPCELIPGRAETDPIEYAAMMSDERYAKKRFPCADCGKKYSSAASMRMHKIRKHGYDINGRTTVLTQQADADADEDAEFNMLLDAEFDDPKTATAGKVDTGPNDNDDDFDNLIKQLVSTSGCGYIQDIKIKINSFGQEDIGHLLQDTVLPKLIELLKNDGLTMDECFSGTVDIVFDDPLHPENKTFVVDEGGKLMVWRDGEYVAPTCRAAAIKAIKQRTTTVMQNPLSFDDVPLAAFVGEIGEKRYEELKEYTYKLDMEDDAELNALTDTIIVGRRMVQKEKETETEKETEVHVHVHELNEHVQQPTWEPV
jgi:hypothetical protein